MRNNNLPALQEHINNLLKQYHLTARWEKKPRPGHYSNFDYKAHTLKRRAYLPRITSEIAYWTSLHEIGHLVADNEPTRELGEISAWLWATQNSIIQVSKQARNYIRDCLNSYNVHVDGL
jgi:hypothetical protein